MEAPVRHEIWEGDEYASGVGGEKVFIVGESHYDDDRKDSIELTRNVVRLAINQQKWLPFFTSLQYAFGEQSSKFWNKVIFLNYVPVVVPKGGSGKVRKQLLSRHDGKERVKQALLTHTPDKVFVFSKFAWSNFLPTEQETQDGATYLIREEEGVRHEWDYLQVSGNGLDHRCKAYGLQHPRPYTSKRIESLRRSVEAAFQAAECKTPAWRVRDVSLT